MVRNKWLKMAALFLTASLFLAGCGSSGASGQSGGQGDQKGTASSTSPTNTKKVSIGTLKLVSSAPIFIGIDKGYFKQQGLDLDVQWFDAAQPIAVATASNKVDIGATGITAGLFNMAAGGHNIAIVADKGQDHKGYSHSALMVRTDLWNQGLHTIQDLKGKKIGITQIGSTYHYMIGRLLEVKGLTLNDVTLTPLNTMSALMGSMKSGQVDAVILNEPNITNVEKAGYGKLITQVGDVFDYQTSAIFFSPDFKIDQDTAIRFLKGYIQAERYYYDACLIQKNGKLVPGTNFDEVVRIVAKYTGAQPDDIKVRLPYIDRDAKLLSSDIQTQIDWYASHKMIDKAIPASQIVDTSLWDEAIKQLGK